MGPEEVLRDREARAAAVNAVQDKRGQQVRLCLRYFLCLWEREARTEVDEELHRTESTSSILHTPGDRSQRCSSQRGARQAAGRRRSR